MRNHPKLKKFCAPILITLVVFTIVAAPARSGSAARVEVIASQITRHGVRTPGRGNSVSFLPAVSYSSVGAGAHSVAVADLNGDGKLDLAVANEDSNNLGILLGNGDGTFQAAEIYDSGGDSVSVAGADVNGDGKLDLVISNYNSATVGILLGNGDGTFQGVMTYSSGGQLSWSVAVADVNGDGKPDLLVTNQCVNICGKSSVGVLLGNGDGTFQSAVTYDSGGGGALSVVVADVNNDSKPDLLVANSDNSTVGVLLGNGDGTFQPAMSYNSGGHETISLAVADVNKDGKPDVLAANTSGTLSVLLGNGDGTFRPSVNYVSGGFETTSVAVADVNGDGKLDLVASNACHGPHGNCANGIVGVLLGNGDGTFQAATIYQSGGFAAEWVAVADINVDGRPDMLVANCAPNGAPFCGSGDGMVGVLLNNTPRPTSTSLTSSLNPSTYGQQVTWTAMVTSSGSITPTGKVRFTWNGNTIGSATLNSSGVATLTKSNLNADTFPLIAVYLGDANNLGSTSAVLNQVVLQATSTAALTSSPNPSMQGQAVTFTATISSPTVIPKGPVTFTAGKTVLGTAQLSGGKAKLTISTLSTGSTKVTATYNGDSDIAKSSASVIQAVQ